MSLNRRKNIYTLGDFHPQHQVKVPSRRQNFDPFEHDPFKIQSYNFRYADRPAFPLPTTASRPKTPAPDKRFETFYYNHDFAPARRDKENPTTNKFHEFRRRKFLYDHQQSAPTYHQHQQHQFARPQQHPTAPQSPRATSFLRRESGAGWNSSFNSTGTSRASTPDPLQCGSHRGHPSEFRSLPTSYVSTDCGNHSRPQQRICSSVNAATSTELFSNRSRTSLSGFGSADGPRRSTASNGLYGNGNRNVNRSSSSSDNNNTGSCSQRAPNTQISNNPSSKPSAQSNRKPLQPLHISAKNVNGIDVSASPSTRTLQCIHSGSTSGCQININIKGLDDQPLGEDVTIKIKSDSSSNIKCRRNHSSHSSHQKETASAARQEPCIQLQRTQSSDSFISRKNSSNKTFTQDNFNNAIKIEKKHSKTSMRNFRSESPKRTVQREEFLLPARKDSSRNINSPHFVVPHRAATERIPSIVSWNSDKNMRDCFSSGNLKASSAFGISSAAQDTNVMRRMMTGYGPSLNDLKNLQRYDKLQQSHDVRRVPPTSPTAKTMPLRAEHNLMMTSRNIEDPRTNRRHYDDVQTRCNFEDLRTNRSIQELRVIHKSGPVGVKKSASTCGKRQESASKHSMCSVKDSRERHVRDSINWNRFSETELRSAHRKRQAQEKLSPLNVNINVFTERLKLLRV